MRIVGLEPIKKPLQPLILLGFCYSKLHKSCITFLFSVIWYHITQCSFTQEKALGFLRGFLCSANFNIKKGDGIQMNSHTKQ